MLVNIADLLPQPIKVEVSEGKYLVLRPLSLQEMIKLLVENQSLFITMYSKFQETGSAESKFGAMLVAAPDFIASLIAMAAGALGQEDLIKQLPPTVQLIAVHELWKASVPDPKKAKELLSVVMDQLRNVQQSKDASPTNSNLVNTQPTSVTNLPQ